MVKMKNTFLEFPEEDPWFIEPNPERQKTDSIVDRSSRSLKSELEQTFPRPFPEGPSFPHKLASFFELKGDFTTGFSPKAPMYLDPAPERTRAAQFAETGATSAQYAAMATAATLGVGANHMPMRDPVKTGTRSKMNNFVGLPGILGFPKQQVRQVPEESPELEQASPEADDESDEEEECDDQVQDFVPPTSLADKLCAKQAAKEMAAPELAGLGGGLNGCTTVMLRHIPCKYTQRKLMREINSIGFLGKFDFFYLPMDLRSHANRGFAFINMCTAEAAEELYQTLHGQRLKHFNSEKVLAVMAADIQGFERNAAHFAASRVLRRKRTQHNTPLFFRPLPENLLLEEAVGRDADLEGPDVFGDNCANFSHHDTAIWDVASSSRLESEWAQFSEKLAAEAPARMRGPQVPARVWHPEEVPEPASSQLDSVAAAAQLVAKFCAFCGQPKQAVHAFCPYCGNRCIA